MRSFILAALIAFPLDIAVANEPWSATPDPLPDTQAFVAAKSIKLSLPMKFPDSIQAAFPVRPSPFIAIATVSAAKFCSWQTLDLRSGQLQPGLSEKMSLSDLILSPDGRCIAARGVGHGSALQAWDISAKKQLLNLLGNARPITFRGDSNQILLAHDHVINTETMTELDLQTGKNIRQYDLPIDIADNGWAISPGGKYLVAAALSKSQIDVVDLDAGKIVGTSSAPGGKSFIGYVYGIAISRDGKEIAVLYELNTRRRIVIWDFATGKVAADLNNITFDLTPSDHDQNWPMGYLPSGKALRIAHFVIDRKSGATLAAIPLPPGETGDYAFSAMIADDCGLSAGAPGILKQITRIESVRIGE
jgi:WD40 repeat protein